MQRFTEKSAQDGKIQTNSNRKTHAFARMVSKWHPITQEKAPKRPQKTKKRKQKEAKGY